MFREIQDIEDLAAYDFKPISFRRPPHRQAGDLSRKQFLSSKRTIVIGPMVAFGGHPERAGLGWNCDIALVLATARPSISAKAYEGSVHFFGLNAEAERRDWICSMRRKGYTVVRMPSSAAVLALPEAPIEKLVQYGLI